MFRLICRQKDPSNKGIKPARLQVCVAGMDRLDETEHMLRVEFRGDSGDCRVCGRQISREGGCCGFGGADEGEVPVFFFDVCCREEEVGVGWGDFVFVRVFSFFCLCGFCFFCVF